jgi:hypothetical protein
MSTPQLLDAPGRRRSPATLPGFHVPPNGIFKTLAVVGKALRFKL